MRSTKVKRKRRARRKRRIRRRVVGTPERPRLTVFRSHRNLSCQIIDDLAGRTLVAASTQEPALREEVGGAAGSTPGAAIVGKRIAERALAAGIKAVCFDRNGYNFHGRVRALAESGYFNHVVTLDDILGPGSKSGGSG